MYSDQPCTEKNILCFIKYSFLFRISGFPDSGLPGVCAAFQSLNRMLPDFQSSTDFSQPGLALDSGEKQWPGSDLWPTVCLLYQQSR